MLLIALCASAVARDEAAKFIGSIGCKSSSCHGGAGEKRSQYITWSQKDFHIRAYTILLDARSARIGEAVGIAQPQSSARCTVCHSPFQAVAADRLTATARPDEGISCESCHGAAESWLRGHTRTDWTYATRVSAGMHDLRNLYLRANACVACHQNVDVDLLKAGHPELVFELDSQSNNEPKHWREDDPATGPRSWLIGQAIALREIIWALNKSAPDDRARLLNDISALEWLLEKSGLANELAHSDVGLEALSAFGGIQQRADEIARRGQNWNPTPESMMSILRALAGTDSEFITKESKEALFSRALRLTLALDRLSAGLKLSSNIDKELNALRADVQRRYDFDTAAFAEHLRALEAKLR